MSGALIGWLEVRNIVSVMGTGYMMGVFVCVSTSLMISFKTILLHLITNTVRSDSLSASPYIRYSDHECMVRKLKK